MSTRTAVAIPDLPNLKKASTKVAEKKQASPTAEAVVPKPASTVALVPPTPNLPSAHGPISPTTNASSPVNGIDASSSKTAAAPSVASPKAVPRTWADLVRLPVNSGKVEADSAVVTNGIALPHATTLSEALRQYSVAANPKLSFLQPRGLVNTGNMCYMNAVLQILVFCTPFYNFLNQVKQRTVHSVKSDTPLVDALIMFMSEFEVLESAESVDVLRSSLKPIQLEQFGEPATPDYVYEAIRKLPRFSNMRRGHQQDAEEFLGFLLEGLHDECAMVMQSQPESQDEKPVDGWLEVRPKQKVSVTGTAGHQEAPSPITKIFGGNLRSELRVPGLKDSVTLEPYKPLQLDIGDANVNNIVDALKGITRVETLTGDFGGKNKSAKKQVFIDKLPPVLVLHLKRFQYDNSSRGTQKIWKRVGYPLELEIPKEVFLPSKRPGGGDKDTPPRYRLISVVYHHGKSAAGGHYTVDVLRQDNREWIRIDDTVIRRVRPEDVADGGADEDPRLLARALEQHLADEGEGRPWSEVNGQAGKKQTTSNGTSTPGGRHTPVSKREGLKDNKVAYILLYERIA
ncbi:cysteine proteinase [Piedraia hortae CBS 480.64]|uniref:Ubiquitin carboxyl-terminal hydrolase n=1 Tax=Piedraia hortae CBS 480.64 TaxID=1314780 RepID=A0A6A7C2A8_9PEZI|nr:cysteine proteinase [Piedraia hortae CBS 480.64]